MHTPVYIISGFLGAGKTTLLNRILREEHGVQFALIINEFGEIGLDGALLNTTQDFVKMDNGCLCCVLNEDLVKTLSVLQKRDDFAAVILETTGVADPLPIAWTFFRQEFLGRFRFGGIITVVDALHFLQSHALADEVRCQIERADYVYLAKSKLAGPELCAQVRKKVSSLQPRARWIADTDHNFYDLIFETSSTLALPAKDHLHTHAPNFQSLAWDLKDCSVDCAAMEDFFTNLPTTVYRAKAIFQDKPSGKTYVMHAVCGRVEFYEAEEKSVLGVVMIGKDLDKAHLISLAPFP